MGIGSPETDIDAEEIAINSAESGPHIQEIEADVRQIGTSRAANASDSEEIGIDNEAIAVN